MKPLILYHADCLDGAGAAFAAWLKFGNEAEYRAVNYDQPPPTDVGGRAVYLLDFSYRREVLMDVARRAVDVVVIDHHKTAAEEYADLLDGGSRFSGRLSEDGYPVVLIVRQEHSGAVLVWQYFHPDRLIPQILLHIEDRDLWKFKIDGTREICAALDVRRVREDFLQLDWIGTTERAIEVLCNEGGAILRARDQQVKFIASTAEVVCLDGSEGEVFLAVNSCVLQSEVGNALAVVSRDQDRFPMAAVWYRDGRAGKYRVSLRSVDDFDVAAIAKRYGGGGHRCAAGFSCDELPW